MYGGFTWVINYYTYSCVYTQLNPDTTLIPWNRDVDHLLIYRVQGWTQLLKKGGQHFWESYIWNKTFNINKRPSSVIVSKMYLNQKKHIYFWPGDIY